MYRYHYCEIKIPHSTNYNITVMKVMPRSLADTYQFPSKHLPTSTQKTVVSITAPIHQTAHSKQLHKTTTDNYHDFFMHNHQLSICQGSQFRVSLYMYRYNSHIPMDNAISPTFISAMAFRWVLEFTTFSHYPQQHSTL